MKELNYIYKTEPALFENDFDNSGFEWVDCRDAERGVISFMRKASNNTNILVICNFTPVPRDNYRVGVSQKGSWKEILNSDAKEYGGSGRGNMGAVETSPLPYKRLVMKLSNICVPMNCSKNSRISKR